MYEPMHQYALPFGLADPCGQVVPLNMDSSIGSRASPAEHCISVDACCVLEGFKIGTPARGGKLPVASLHEIAAGVFPKLGPNVDLNI